jgi:hypothetical protein
MKNLALTTLVTPLVVISLISPVKAEMATMGEAVTVANNWIIVMVQKNGAWGDTNTAYVEDVQEFKRDGRLLGYFCRVRPKGFIVVSIRKELAPVKAYSATSTLVPECEVGLPDLIKDRMEDILSKIEKEVGPIGTARTEDVSELVDINYRSVWAKLERDEQAFENELVSGMIAMDYEEGQVMLTTNWRQGDPYNLYCPASPPDSGCTEPRCSAGCTATAAAQIMRFWCWPPFGAGEGYSDPYDWPNMPENLATTSPAVQINAVAELCYEIGLAVGMKYCDEGCASGGPMVGIDGMQGAYGNRYFYYPSVVTLDRSMFDTPDDWFWFLVSDLNKNRPIQYGVEDHSMVVDGWRVTGGTKQYHMNYGWAGGNSGAACWSGIPNSNTWYTVDALPCSNPSEQYILCGIYPLVALGPVISGTYSRTPSFPYWYFDQDAYGDNATFEAGQYLQFLHNIKVSSSLGAVRFVGSDFGETRLFTRGDPSQGARINEGVISLYSGGSMKLY